jgi:hypothetical protein
MEEVKKEIEELKTIHNLNVLLADCLDFDPLTGFQEPDTQLASSMNYGLAQVYANEGLRLYIQNEINRALKATATRSLTLVDMAAGKSRALTLKELLVKGKQAFEELQEIESLRKLKQQKG